MSFALPILGLTSPVTPNQNVDLEAGRSAPSAPASNSASAAAAYMSVDELTAIVKPPMITGFCKKLTLFDISDVASLGLVIVGGINGVLNYLQGNMVNTALSVGCVLGGLILHFRIKVLLPDSQLGKNIRVKSLILIANHALLVGHAEQNEIAKGTVTRLETSLQEAKALVAQVKAQRDSSIKEIEGLTGRLEKAKKELEAMDKKYQQLLSTMTNQTATLHQANLAMSSASSQMQPASTGFTAIVSGLTVASAKLSGLITGGESQNQAKESKLQAMEVKITELKALVADLTAKLEAERKRNDDIVAMIQSIEAAKKVS